MKYKLATKNLDDNDTVDIPEGAVGVTLAPVETWAPTGKNRMTRSGWKMGVQYLEPLPGQEGGS